jgi:hypothetical protein
MADVVQFPGVTKLDLNADDVLSAAIGELDEVVICGFGKDGSAYFASSVADGGQALWHLERAKWALMKITDELENGDD